MKLSLHFCCWAEEPLKLSHTHTHTYVFVCFCDMTYRYMYASYSYRCVRLFLTGTCRDEMEVGIHVLLTLMVLCVCMCVSLCMWPCCLRSAVRLQRFFFLCVCVGVLVLSFCPFSRRSIFFFSFPFSFFSHKFQGHWFTLASDSDAHAHKRISGWRSHGNAKADTAETGECGHGRNKCYFTRRPFNCRKVE